jgi:hypothetical protein
MLGVECFSEVNIKTKLRATCLDFRNIYYKIRVNYYYYFLSNFMRGRL